MRLNADHIGNFLSKFQIEQSRKLSILDSRCWSNEYRVEQDFGGFAIPAYIFPNYDNRTRASDIAAEEGSSLNFTE